MDFNDDEPSAPTAKPAFKFQPKAKAKPRVPPPKKVTAAVNPSIPQQAADNQPVASPAKAQVPNNVISDSADASNAGVKSTISVEQTTNLQTSSSADSLLSSKENLSTISSGHIEENANSKDSASQGLHSGESMIESAEVFDGMYPVDDIMPPSIIVEDATFDASNSHNEEDMTAISVDQEQLSCKESVAFSNVGDIQMERVQLETEQQGEQTFTSSDFMSEVGVSSGKRATKFKPKLKNKTGKKTRAIESASDPKDTFVAPSETHNTNEGSVDGVTTDLPHVRVDDASSANPHNECLLNRVGSFEASPDFISDIPSGTDATTDCLLNQVADVPQSSSGLIHDFPSQQNASLSEHMDSQSAPVGSEAENNDGHNEEKGRSKKKKSSTRSNKDANGSDKSVQKRKKTTEASEKSNEQPPKKFSRSTRRRNRSINKSLLETPEDEIDYLSLPIKDLIMLAEHRERQNKEVVTKQPAEENPAPAPAVEPVRRTSDNMWDDNPYDEDVDDLYGSAQAEVSFDNPSTSTVERDIPYFNYHSHMDKTPRVKWSKQDTELFYEGLRQFGSDLSMIQHLFPGRTRHQIKLKYKKEERQQPMKLLDALTNRSKDLSHYKLVIGRLQEQIDREEEQQRAEEEALGTTGNEGSPEEGAAADTQEQAQNEAAKSEQKGDDSGAVQDHDEVKIGSPTASDDSELDTCAWSEYKSEF